MTKVSKNIKRARTRQSLTQDALAEQLHVTRQTVSSWETGRTQPDLDMLLQLCTALNVPAEELLYGEKRNTSLDAPAGYRGTVKIVLTSLACLFIAAGALLVLLNGWKDLPRSVRYVCAFLPLLGGQGAALYVLLKRRDSAAHAEGGSVLWAVGLLATTALLYTLQHYAPDIPVVALVLSLLILPMFLLLRSLSALTFYIAGITVFASTATDDWLPLASLTETQTKLAVFVVYTVLVAAGLFAAKRSLAAMDEQRRHVGVWFCFAAAVDWCICCAAVLDTGVFSMLLCVAVTLYALDGIGQSKAMATRYLALPGLLFLLLLASGGVLFSLPSDWTFSPVMLPGFLLLGVLPLGALIANRRVLLQDKLRLGQIAAGLAGLAFYTVMYLTENNADDKRAVVFQAITFVLAVLLVIQGAIENALFKINLGFISVCVLASFLVWHAEFGLWLKGLILLGFGVLLLLINRHALSRKQKAITERQVPPDEG